MVFRKIRLDIQYFPLRFMQFGQNKPLIRPFLLSFAKYVEPCPPPERAEKLEKRKKHRPLTAGGV